MGNIADQCLVFPFVVQLLLRIVLQTLTHLLKGDAQFTDLVLTSGLYLKIQIALLDILRSSLKLFERSDHAAVNPDNHHKSSDQENEKNRHNHLNHHSFDFRHGAIHGGDNEHALLLALLRYVINLLH